MNVHIEENKPFIIFDNSSDTPYPGLSIKWDKLNQIEEDQGFIEKNNLDIGNITKPFVDYNI